MNKTLIEGLWIRYIKSAQKNILTLAFISSFCIILISCKKEYSIIGETLLPNEENLVDGYDSLIHIKSYTVAGRNVNSFFAPIQWLGCFTDPYFGSTKASLFTEFRPYDPMDDFSKAESYDSLMLYLPYYTHYGNMHQTFQVYVYEISSSPFINGVTYDTTRMIYDVLYENEKTYDIDDRYTAIQNSNLLPDNYTHYELLGSGIFWPEDSLLGIQITNTDFIDRIFAFASLYDSVHFLNYFKGLYITTENIDNEGALFAFTFSSEYARMELIYHIEEERETYTFRIDNARRFSIFQHDYAGYPVENHINDSISQDSIIFIQSMGGVNSIIDFTYLDTLLEKVNFDTITINKAELILKPAFDYIPYDYKPEDYFPDQLYLYIIADSLYAIPDYYSTSDYIDGLYIDGSYDKKNQFYTLNLTHYIIKYIKGEIETKRFLILPGNNYENAISPGHIILKSGYHSNPIKLKIYYTKF